MRCIALKIKERILQFNLFESKLSWTDAERRQIEILTTRLYLILLSLCIALASIYTSSILQTQIFTMKNPSIETFEKLSNDPRYSATLECPCRNLTIPYNRFIQIPLRSHQICTSDFVVSNSQWLKDFSPFMFDNNYPYNDFRRFIVPQFRALASLCHIVKDTLTDALSSFMNSTIISEQAESYESVQSKVTSAVTQFQLSTMGTFKTRFNQVREMVNSNRFVSFTLSNSYLSDTLWKVGSITDIDEYLPRFYGNGTCSCDKSPVCSSPACDDQCDLPGFRVGCYAIESLLQSTLECLYDIACINRMIPNDIISTMVFHALDPALSSPTATVQSLLDNLMIDEWRPNFTYDRYYTACAARYCTYSLTQRFDSVYVFTTIMGLSGGLTVVLKLILPYGVKLARHVAKYFSRAVRPLIITGTDINAWDTDVRCHSTSVIFSFQKLISSGLNHRSEVN